MGKVHGLMWGFSATSFSEADIGDVNDLLSQLSRSHRKITFEKLEELVIQPNHFLLWVRSGDDRIVGMATIVIYETLMGKIGVIEDVVVDKNHRGQGIGRQLIKYLIRFAKAKDVHRVNLTSSPSRKEANELYLKLGFEKHETNCYRLVL